VGKIPMQYKDKVFEGIFLVGCCPNGHLYTLRKNPNTYSRRCPKCGVVYER